MKNQAWPGLITAKTVTLLLTPPPAVLRTVAEAYFKMG